jgi:hypothetical protein
MAQKKVLKEFNKCNLFVKLFRSRWYVLVPIVTLSIFLKSKKEFAKNNQHWILDYDECRNISIGLVNWRMNKKRGVN